MAEVLSVWQLDKRDRPGSDLRATDLESAVGLPQRYHPPSPSARAEAFNSPVQSPLRKFPFREVFCIYCGPGGCQDKGISNMQTAGSHSLSPGTFIQVSPRSPGVHGVRRVSITMLGMVWNGHVPFCSVSPTLWWKCSVSVNTQFSCKCPWSQTRNSMSSEIKMKSKLLFQKEYVEASFV